MVLPTTSFPNTNAVLSVDDYQRRYLTAWDFIKFGGPVTVAVFVLVISWGYALFYFVFG
jgi:hypothetical protein